MKTFFVLFALSLWLSSFAVAQVRVKENIRQRSVDTVATEDSKDTAEKASPKSSKKKASSSTRK